MWGSDHLFSSYEHQSLEVAMHISAIVSLVCSVLIVVTHVWFPSLRQKSCELVVWMSCSNIGSCINTIVLLNLSQNGSQTDCTLYGFFAVFFYVSGAFWCMIIANTLSLVLIRRNDLLNKCSQIEAGKYMKWNRAVKFHVAVWGTSLLCALLPAAMGYFEITQNNWCWYGGDAEDAEGNPNSLMEILTYILPLSISVVYCLSILLAVLYNMKNIKESALKMRDPLNIELYELIRVLKYFPVVLIITEGYNVAVQIATYALPHQNFYWEYLIMVILLQSQGTLYFFAYFRRHIIRETWLTFLFPNAAASTRASLSIVDNSSGILENDPKAKLCYRACACLCCISAPVDVNSKSTRKTIDTSTNSNFNSNSNKISDALRIEEALVSSGYLASEAGSVVSNRGHEAFVSSITSGKSVDGILGGYGSLQPKYRQHSDESSERSISTGTSGTNSRLHSTNSDRQNPLHIQNNGVIQMSPNGTTILGLEDL